MTRLAVLGVLSADRRLVILFFRIGIIACGIDWYFDKRLPESGIKPFSGSLANKAKINLKNSRLMPQPSIKWMLTRGKGADKMAFNISGAAFGQAAGPAWLFVFVDQ